MIKAVGLFELGLLDELMPGTFEALSFIHRHLFEDVYDYAGVVRAQDMSKGNVRLASALCLPEALKAIERMPQATFDEIIAKYVEMNVAHPFREGNGRSTRLWLDLILKNELGVVVDWSKVDEEDYLLAMERSPVRDLEIKTLLQAALTNKVNDREVFTKGIDASYRYEGYSVYKTEDITEELIDEYLIEMASERLNNAKGQRTYSHAEIMEEFGITQADLDAAEDLEID